MQNVKKPTPFFSFSKFSFKQFFKHIRQKHSLKTKDKSKTLKQNTYTNVPLPFFYVIKRFFQAVYLSLKLYIQNSLLESAASCAYGFVFSFIPILMLIWSFMLGLLKANPSMLQAVEVFLEPYKKFFDIEVVLKYIWQSPSLTLSNILLLCFVLWMSKKFFSSIIAGFMRIFKTVLPPRTLLNQLLGFAGTFFIVILTSFVFALTFAMRQFFSLSVFSTLKFNMASTILVYISLYLILLLGCTIMFRIYSGTKPQWRLCLFCSTLCAVGFWGFGVFIQLFFNLINYDIVYGVLSNLILLVFSVYGFFIIFGYFAQFIYVTQFFDVHYLEMLYILQEAKKPSLLNKMLKKLFYYDFPKEPIENTIYLEEGEAVFKKGMSADFAFFVIKGQVSVYVAGKKKIYKENSFFGEHDCLVYKKYSTQAVCLAPCVLKKITKQEFQALIDKNPHIALKVIAG